MTRRFSRSVPWTSNVDSCCFRILILPRIVSLRAFDALVKVASNVGPCAKNFTSAVCGRNLWGMKMRGFGDLNRWWFVDSFIKVLVFRG